MQLSQYRAWALACLISLSGIPALVSATTVEITHTAKNASVELGRTVWFLGKVDGKGVYMNFAVNGIPGGNASVGTLNSQNGEYVAPKGMPPNAVITVTGTTATTPKLSASTKLTLSAASTSTGATTPPTPSPAPGTIGPQPAADPATVAAARLLERATFGPNAASIAAVKQMGAQAWLNQQYSMPATPLPQTTDMNALRNGWYMNMVNAPDQVRQRMLFALSQLFVVSADKNNNANELLPWLATLDKHAFGKFGNLLREMTLNPSMGKYLDLANSRVPAPNENYAREVMQLFTIGPVMLNQDGSVQRDRNGAPIPSYTQDSIAQMARALSGWTYTGSNLTSSNWENFTGPLQPRDSMHDKGAKVLLNGASLPAGQSTVQDLDGVMQNLLNHPNLPPFIAVRLIRAFTTSNPSPAYIERVANVFAYGPNGRGDLKATLNAVLMDPEALVVAPTAGKLKDPMLHSLSLFRATGATVLNPQNLFWDYFLLGERLLQAPSVFNFYSPLAPLPGNPAMSGPEFQLYTPAQAVGRADFLYAFIAGNYAGMVSINLAPYQAVAGNPTALLNLVDATLLQGRMTPSTRAAIGATLLATTDLKQRAITALYLTAIAADFAVQQ
ncbi:DUF1800 domain-containing protein [Pseudoduganella violaceinigra]|uniref:DUF1800 domain-containing protein n=1 Tax=Pseudoduganella violaceinigra TaxID=246602 RepID=UPI000A04F62F|nr:DUF1800 domain-containing protein [Pseudoduganella violaceinigra]